MQSLNKSLILPFFSRHMFNYKTSMICQRILILLTIPSMLLCRQFCLFICSGNLLHQTDIQVHHRIPICCQTLSPILLTHLLYVVFVHLLFPLFWSRISQQTLWSRWSSPTLETGICCSETHSLFSALNCAGFLNPHPGHNSCARAFASRRVS